MDKPKALDNKQQMVKDQFPVCHTPVQILALGHKVSDDGLMNTAAIDTGAVSSAGFAEKLAGDVLALWSQACQEFLERERREILAVKPVPEKLASHLKDLKAMIRLTAWIMGQVADPDSRSRQYLPEVKGRLLQLENSWELLTNPMTDEEADALLEQCFPSHAPGS